MARFKWKDVNEKAVIGGRVCVINEAEEPTEILWANIDSTLFDRHVLTLVLLYFVKAAKMYRFKYVPFHRQRKCSVSSMYRFNFVIGGTNITYCMPYILPSKCSTVMQ